VAENPLRRLDDLIAHEVLACPSPRSGDEAGMVNPASALTDRRDERPT
jgi:hypothetical protein